MRTKRSGTAERAYINTTKENENRAPKGEPPLQKKTNRRLYSLLFSWYKRAASEFAGEFGFGSQRSDCSQQEKKIVLVNDDGPKKKGEQTLKT
jgi:hypothetical protein